MDVFCVLIVGCLSLQAPIEPPPLAVSPSAYNEQSSLIEYVVATHYVADESDVTALVAPVRRPFEGYWLDDPVTAAVIDEYNVGTVGRARPAAKPIASATTFHKRHGDGRTAAVRAVRKAARKRPGHPLGVESRPARRDHTLRADQRLVANRIKLD